VINVCNSPIQVSTAPALQVPDLPDLPPGTPIDVLPQSRPSPLTQSGRPRREYRLPKRFRDDIPEPPAPVPATPPNPDPVRRVILIVRDRLTTVINSFGIWRDYPRRPADPDSVLTLEDLSNTHHSNTSNTSPPDPSESRSSYWPFSNATVYAVMQWMNNRQTTKSEAETTKFIHNVILSPTFDADDLAGFDAHRENQ